MNLYPHQTEGIAFLRERGNAGLFDDPGLGKTITALCAARGMRRVLVLSPSCVTWNWKREAEKWLGCDVQLLTTGKDYVDPFATVVVMSHGLLLSPLLLGRLKREQWTALIVDESHFFRGRTAKRVRLLYRELATSAQRLWLLTGTPMPNDASDLWTMCSGGFGFPETFEDFRDRYCKTAWSPYGDNVKVVGNQNIVELRERLRPFVLRRRKDDVLDLPPVRYEEVALRPAQLPHELPALQGEIGEDVAELLDGSDTAEEAFERLGQSKPFANFRRLCGMAKADAVAELLELELESGALPKVVVFAHHKAVVERITDRLHAFHPQTITGQTSPGERDRAVRAFQAGGACRVIVCNILAGGTGTTLTASADVVFAELSFVPGENAQAADRIRRIGQTKPCRVRFVSLAGTLDEAVVRVLKRKSQMIREVMEK